MPGNAIVMTNDGSGGVRSLRKIAVSTTATAADDLVRAPSGQAVGSTVTIAAVGAAIIAAWGGNPVASTEDFDSSADTFGTRGVAFIPAGGEKTISVLPGEYISMIEVDAS